jgi:hypothetical protein
MLELRLATGNRSVPFYRLPMVLGRQHATRELGETIEALIEVLDRIAGDPDYEETDAEDSFALPERARQFAAGLPGCVVGDPGGGDIVDEPHDAEEDACEAGDDGCGPVWRCGDLHWGSQWDREGI